MYMILPADESPLLSQKVEDRVPGPVLIDEEFYVGEII